MAGYTRQSSFADGDTITAALFNDEYNQLVNAFSNTTGHSHDGTAASGPVIGLIGDAGETSPNNKVLIDTTNNYIEFYVEVSSSPVQQLYIADGAIVPVTDSDVDLGTTSLRFKDTYTDTVTTTGNVSVGGNLTVTGNATISGNLTFGDADTDSINLSAEIDSHIVPNTDDTYDLGTTTKQWRNLYIDGTAEIDTLAIDGTTVTSTAAELNILDGVTSTAAELNILDGVTSTTAELNILDGVTATATEINLLDGVTSTTAELNILDGVTATAAEINILDGVTSTAAELNILDGVTSTTAELNILDGVTSTATELNILDGVTSTTAELNILDGVTSTTAELNILDGVTSTATELNIVDGSTAATSTTLADADRVVVNDNGTMVQVALTDFETYFESALDTLSNVTTVGALNSGSITSGFGSIDNGSSAITTTGTITYGSLSDGTITITAFVDEDDMSSNSATLVPTQQSVKAYVDAQILTEDTLAELNDTNITTPTDGALLFYDTTTSKWIDNVVSGDITIADTGVATIAAGSVDNAMLAGSIANAKLANSTVSYGGVSVALGASDATPAFDLTDATNYPTSSLTGTITNAQLAGSIAVSKTLLTAGTGLTLTTDTLSVDAAQTQITSLGTLTTLTVDNVIINGTTIGHTDDTDLMTVADGVLTVAGEVDATSLDISGDIDVDGTANLDNTDIDGTLNTSGVVTCQTSANISQVAITSSSNSIAWDAAAAANAYHVTTENTTFAAPSNATEGAIISVEIAQGATARTIAWNTVFEFAASTAPTITATANKTDILAFRYNGSVWQEIGRVQNLAQT